MTEQLNTRYQKYTKFEIRKMEELATDVYLMSFRREFEFLPGQVIGITDSIEKPPRMYSIASGNNDPLMQILFDVEPEGYLTPRMARLKAGDTLYLTLPYGRFLCDDIPAYWIAAGTGIAPFVSMIRSGNTKNKTLIHGARSRNSFFFSELFKSELKENYICCCSGEKSGGDFDGRVTDFLQISQNLPKNVKYFICGRAEMVVDTRDILIAKGIPYENIMAEIYF
jgi:ferredoxin/flavodoxin---NADP+ reductase